MKMINQIEVLARRDEEINRAIAIAKAAVTVLNENGVSATLRVNRSKAPKKVGALGAKLPKRARPGAKSAGRRIGVRKRYDGVPESYLMDEEELGDEVPAIRDDVPAIRDGSEIYGDIGEETVSSDHSIDMSQLSDAARAGVR